MNDEDGTNERSVQIFTTLRSVVHVFVFVWEREIRAEPSKTIELYDLCGLALEFTSFFSDVLIE